MHWFLLFRLVGREASELNFYEYTSPYFAVIKAKSVESSDELYKKFVADMNEYPEGDFVLEVAEIDRDYALATYSRTLSEELEDVPVQEILTTFKSEEEMVIMVDGNL